MIQLYTSSRLRVLRSCLFKHHLRYELGLRGPETGVMRFGTAIHAALEAYLNAWRAGLDRLAAALAVANAYADDLDRAKLLALVIGYDARWGAANWEILAVEVEFRYELDGHQIGGKIDAIIRDLDDGRVYVLEHKSTSQDTSTGSVYWQKLTLDTQVSIYIDGATVLGHEIAGVIYDVLVRPAHDRKLATPEADRKYTVGKGCKLCGGTLQGKQGTGKVGDVDCAVCQGTGWRLADGKPESPRLYANQRAEDETFDDLLGRIGEAIADAPDDFYRRATIVRLEDDITRMRAGLLETIKLDQLTRLVDVRPPNPDACASFGSLCPYFEICCGRASADDIVRFPRGAAHSELAA